MSAAGERWRRIWYLLNRGRPRRALRDEMDAHPRDDGRTRAVRQHAAASRTVQRSLGWAWLDALVRDFGWPCADLSVHRYSHSSPSCRSRWLALTTTTVSVVNAYLSGRCRTELGSPVPRHVPPPGPWEPHGMTGLDWDVRRGRRRVPDRGSWRSVLSERGWTHALTAAPADDPRIR